MGKIGQRCRSEIHCNYYQTPRWFCYVWLQASTYNIVDATPFKRDIIKELADACRKKNMKLGFYYSQAQDWHHRGGAISGGKEWDEAQVGDMNKYIDSIAVPQVKEILENYGDVAVL